MLDFQKILFDGGLLTFAFLSLVLIIGVSRPRLFLSKDDVPADILAAVPPRTKEEERLGKWIMLPLFIILTGGMLYSTFTFQAQSGAGFLPTFLHALAIILMFSIGDLVLMDWLILNTITPRWAVYPGTEGFAGYKDYGFHLRAHVKALPSLVIGAAVIAALVLFLAQVL